jgi:hypothetical protein
VFRYLAAKTEAGIDQPGRLNVSNITAWAQDGRLQGYFTIALPSASLASQPFIFASGPLSSQGICQFHADGEGGVTVNLQSGVLLAASGGIDDHKSVVRALLKFDLPFHIGICGWVSPKDGKSAIGSLTSG